MKTRSKIGISIGLALLLAAGAHPASAEVKVACIGDSITFGYGTATPFEGPLQTMLGSGYKVLNFGYSGATLLKQGDTPYVSTQTYRDSLTSSPDIVIIMLGTNDSKSWNWVHSADYVPNYEEMITTYRNLPSHPQVYVALSPKVYGNTFQISDTTTTVIVPLQRQIAAKMGCPIVDVNYATTDLPQDFADGVHPNPAGDQVIAQTMYNAVKFGATAVNLNAVANVSGMYGDGVAFTTGGLDNVGFAMSATVLGKSQTWSGVPFDFMAPNVPNSVSGVTVPLPQSQFSTISFLATGVEGAQPSQTFTVNYTDGTKSNYTQDFSDWGFPKSYAGESDAISMDHRDSAIGGLDAGMPFHLYGYKFALNSAKTVSTLALPANRNIIVTAMTVSTSN